jgi:hypothetical protein
MSKTTRIHFARLLFLFASITVSGSAFADCLPNPSGLIGWWPGDGHANNLLGTNNGTLQGGATASASGLVGNTFTFDGTNNFVQIPNSPILQPTNLTIEAWIKFSGLDSAGTGPAAGVQNIIFKQNTQSSSFEGFDLGKTRVSGSDYFRFIVSSGSGQAATIRSSTTISSGVWYHVAAVRGPNFTQLYINGVLERQTNVAFAQNYGTQPLYFGTTGQSYWDRRFKGNLDEVSLYNRALSSNEISALFTAGAAGKCKAPNITSQPQSQVVSPSSNVTFTVAATGFGTLSYQWRSNSIAIPGASSASLTLTNVSVNATANYSVVVTNLLGSATSAPATLTVVGLTFTEVANLRGLFWGPLAATDLDNDGKIDFIAAGWDEGVAPGTGWVATTRVYHNDGNGLFSVWTNTGLPDVRGSNLTPGDYDHDGRVDLLLSGQGDGSVKALGLYRNLGNGTFSNVITFAPFWAGLGFGDSDNDGDLDVSMFGSFSGYDPTLFRNDGSNIFTTLGAPVPSYFGAASWNDYDQDGFADLLVTGNPGSGTVRRLYRNNGNSTFGDIGVNFPVDGATAWGDFDNDGDPDLLSSGSSGNMIYRNEGNNAFTALTAGLPNSPTGEAIWGDFNNDGYLDVFMMGAVGPGYQTRLFLNNNGIAFTDSGLTLPAVGGQIRCADLDNDGDLDFAIIGSPTSDFFLTGVFKVYRNDLITPNVRPNPPTNLTATITNFGTRLVLSWNAAADANQTAGLSYNLRLGTQPGASDVFSATADPTNGFRRLVAAGNSGGRLERVFTNFPAGVYYWSVQAIDHSFLGSDFAAEATFMVSKPTITDVSDRTIVPDAANQIPFSVTALGTSVDTLTFTAMAADTNLIPANGFSFTGSGSNRILVITPNRHQPNSTTVTIAVTDTNGATASDSFVVEVRHTFTLSGANFPIGSTVWGDYDNDGRPDLLLLSSPMRLYRNNPNGSFTEVAAGLPTNLSGNGTWADFNNDGWLDLALIGWNGTQYVTAFLRNQQNGTFTNIQANIPGLTGSAAWGDFDSDGDLDLLVGGATLCRNDAGVFTTMPSGLPGGAYLEEAWGDYNLDGLLDVLMEAEGQTSIYQNKGNGTFSNILANIPGVSFGHPAWGDFDNDGFLDVGYTGSNGSAPTNRTTEVYRNNRDGTFTNINAGLWDLEFSGLAWGDFDNDGWLDLVITGTTNYIGSFWIPALAYHNNGDGTFTDQPVEFFGGYGHLRWVDYDVDGALDLLIGQADAGTPTLYHNDTPKKNTAPQPPTGMAAQILSNNTVVFTWTPPSDDETTSPTGLNYNLRVGTTPGGVEIMSPQADLATGRRRIPQRGNAAATNMWLLKDLPPDTYYWSVQAIDPGLVGSPFSTEHSFAITNHRPVVSISSPQTISHSVLSAPLSFLVGDVETPAANLLVFAGSANPNLIPNEQIFLSGTGSNRTVQLRPLTNQVGPVTITLTVTDGAGATRDVSFVANVTNLPPYLSGLSNVTVLPGVTVPVIPFTLGDAESAPDQLLIAATSSNTNLVANPNLVISGTGSNRILHVTPTPGLKGATTVRLIASDSLGVATTNSFVLRIGDFQEIASGLPDVQQGAADWGDFDNDGDLDLLLCGRLPNNTAITRIYRYNGNGNFSDLGVALPGISGTIPPTISWADYDGDDDLDFVMTGNPARIYRNDGNSTFTNIATGLSNSTGAVWLDFDNDGDLDMVTCNNTIPAGASVIPRIFRNNGDGTFTDSGIALPIISLVGVGDYDNDGDVDLALGGTYIKQTLATVLMRNDQTAWFTNGTAGLQVPGAVSMAWGDFNQDGWLDLLLTGPSGNTNLTRLHLNNSNETFSVVATNLPGITSGTAIGGDFDHDGRLDIFLTGAVSSRDVNSIAQLYRNGGSNVFTDSSEPLTGTRWSAAAAADFNNDGRLDLLYCGTTNNLNNGSRTMLLQNQLVGSNTPPTTPTNLFTSNLTSNGVVLNWSPATDAESGGNAGLTYNLRIGTNSGGSQIMAASANPITGWRRLARAGNAGTITSWPLRLPPGIYYWSVQAIDAGYAGSPFAAESSFAIFGPPQLTVLGLSTNGFQFSFSSRSGITYVVEYRDSLNLGLWQELEQRVGTGGTEIITDASANDAMRYYRVRAFYPAPF